MKMLAGVTGWFCILRGGNSDLRWHKGRSSHRAATGGYPWGLGRSVLGWKEDRFGRPGGEMPVLIRKPETRNRKERAHGAFESYWDGRACKMC